MRPITATALLVLALVGGSHGAFRDATFDFTKSQELRGRRAKDTPPQPPASKTQLATVSVQTTEGTVVGDYPQWNIQVTDLFYGTRAWKGLAYAQPPVGNLRFKAPLPAQPYTTQPYKAVNEKPACPQFRLGAGGLIGDEDCLYLDVYAPVTAPNRTILPNGYPVMVFFHGGYYTFSGISSFDGATFAKKDTVVVNVNFRLGLLGAMLSSDGTTFPGNQHFLDQQLALRWVQNNIQHFDGDKTKVTLMGSSTGSSDILCHMTAPSSQGLFHAVVLNSAYFIQKYDSEADAKAVGQAAITEIGCATAADPNACMLTQTTQSILGVQLSYFITGRYQGPGAQTDHHRIFGPFVKPGGVLPMQPIEAFALGQVSDVPMITGTVRAEGGSQTFSLYPDPLNSTTFRAAVATRFGPQNVDRLVALYPFPNPKIYPSNTDYRFALQDMFGDYWRNCPEMRFLRASQIAPGLLVMKRSTYVYMFRFTPTNNYATYVDRTSGCQFLACHSDQLAFVWADLLTMLYSADSVVARSMNSAVTNFIHTFNPSVGVWVRQLTNKWPTYNLQTQKLAIIDYPKGEVARNFRARQCQFWDSFVDP